MESSPGKNAPSLITRRVEANTTCFIPDTQQKPSGGGGDPEFAVRLKCNVTKYIRAGPKRGQTRAFVYRGTGAEASFVAAAGAEDVPGDEDGVRGVMRRLLRAIRPLRELDLTDGEWEAILPEDVVPLLADLSRRRRRDGSRVATVVEMAVDLHVRYRKRAQAADDGTGPARSGSACMQQ